MFSIKRLNTQFNILLGQFANRHSVALLALLMYFILTHFTFAPNLVLSDNNPFSQLFNLTAIGVIFFSIDIFKSLRSRTAGIYYQMTPATITEKWLAALLYSTLLTVVVFFVAFMLVHVLIITGANLFDQVDHAYQFPEWASIWNELKGILLIQSLFFLGGTLFKKNPFLKTVLIIVATLVLFSLIMGLVIKHEFDINSFSVSFDSNKGIQGLEVIDRFKILVDVLVVFSWILPFGCWAAAWYRLKTIQH